jgi:hypothetical protein
MARVRKTDAVGSFFASKYLWTIFNSNLVICQCQQYKKSNINEYGKYN